MKLYLSDLKRIIEHNKEMKNLLYLYDGERKFGYVVGDRQLYFRKISNRTYEMVDDFHNKKIIVEYDKENN